MRDRCETPVLTTARRRSLSRAANAEHAVLVREVLTRLSSDWCPVADVRVMAVGAVRGTSHPSSRRPNLPPSDSVTSTDCPPAKFAPDRAVLEPCELPRLRRSEHRSNLPLTFVCGGRGDGSPVADGSRRRAPLRWRDPWSASRVLHRMAIRSSACSCRPSGPLPGLVKWQRGTRRLRKMHAYLRAASV